MSDVTFDSKDYVIISTSCSTPTISGVDLRAFLTSEGVGVEFVAYDVEADGSVMLALMDGDTVAWSDSVAVKARPLYSARFLVPYLELNGTCDFQVREEVGKWWDAPGVTVQPFAAEMVSASLTCIELTFSSLAEREYNIQWVAELGNEWTTIEAVTASGDKTSVVVAPPPPESTTGYFRVQLK